MISRFFTTTILAVALISIVGCASDAKKELSPAEKKAKLYYNQGTRDLVSQDYTKALNNLLEASSLDPDNSDIHNNLGMAYYFKKSTNRAIIHIKKAISLDPKNTDAKLNLATIHMAKGSLTQAEILYRQILEDLTYEGQQRTHYNLGMIELRRKNQSEALKQFNTALQLDPNYCPAHYRLAEISFNSHRYEEALKQYREAGMGTCTNNPAPLHGQVESLIKLGRYPDALAKLKDMQEQFAMTDYESYARKTIIKVKALQRKEEQTGRSYSKNYEAEIKAVDF